MGKVARCPHCDIGLTYHKGRERLVCHYCGYSVPFLCLARAAKGFPFYPAGQGNRACRKLLSDASASGRPGSALGSGQHPPPGAMEGIARSFSQQEAQVLVGTQMLSKGHHFPHVTLAVVADGDIGLNLPDYRAAERTFQLWCSHQAGPGAAKAGAGHYPNPRREPLLLAVCEEQGLRRVLRLRNRSAQAAQRYPPSSIWPCCLPPYGLGGRADAARADYGSAAFGEQRRDRSWPRARAAAAPAGTQAVSVPPQAGDWRRSVAKPPIIAASRLARTCVFLDIDPVNML